MANSEPILSPLAASSGESDIKGSVSLPKGGSAFRRFLAFSGPAVMVSVGYMDPGNWGTDLAGGSKYGYALLWVILLSNLIAQFLQVLCVKLGLVTGMDLAEACREVYSKPVSMILWVLAELAIIACDLAEVIGSAVALNLLFGLPLWLGVVITGLDVLLLLGFMKFGFRKLEALVGTLVLSIFVCFAYQIFKANPVWGDVAGGLKPTMPNMEALAISLGILGATVMPHNLYLHSSTVQSRRTGHDHASVKEAIMFNTWDTVIALSIAFFVNAAILVLAASVFHTQGVVVEELSQGHKLLAGALGGTAATAFAVALLCSGQSSTITGTLAGQVVMEGFLKLKIAPWKRRLITRLLAMVPALVIVVATGGKKTVELLIISQLVLSVQLPFAIFPLLQVTSDKKRMGEFVNKPWVKYLGYLCGTVIAGLNVYLVVQLLKSS
ncbi:MAG: Nramp family divalent metal transporter [Armatimonadetes bacterium]|nr:Nramp family divalent metal transporter [Armatimonadota bacterium]